MLRLLALLSSLFLTAPASAGEVTVFAAASLKTALDEVALGFENATSHQVTIAYAGSSALARQIQQGAPADIFISANPDWMDVLEQGGLIKAGSRVDLLTNTLVLIHHAPLVDSFEIGLLPEFIGEDRLAMALVDAVPAGIYGKAALEHRGLWDQLSPNVVQTDNVRAALFLVAIGEAPFGIVYATDARASGEVSVVASFPASSHPPITYPAAVVSNNQPVGFLDYLQSDVASAVFQSHGFGLGSRQ